MKLTQGSIEIINTLKENGFEGYVVGGAVRDAFLGNLSSDIDIATSATPEEMLKVFSNFKVYKTGIKHGTITVQSAGEFIEVTTYRVESGYSDNRRPDTVDFVKDIKEDLKRRDFTINAMAYNEDGGLIDYFDGIPDLKNGVIRTVGNADERFKEDALRILRALRFASVLDFKIEEETQKACIRNRSLLKNISVERIYAEFNKLLVGKGAGRVLLENKEVIFEIIPELKDCDGFEQFSKYHCYDVYTHIVKSVEFSERDRLVRWALLLHDVKKPECFTLDQNKTGHFYGHHLSSSKASREILKRLKADNYTIEMVYKAVYMHDFETPTTKIAVKKFLKENGYEFLKILSKVKVGDALAHNSKYTEKRKENAYKFLKIANEVLENKECFELKTLAINGNDLKSVGFSGASIKTALDTLLNEVIEEKIENNKEKLLLRASLLKF